MTVLANDRNSRTWLKSEPGSEHKGTGNSKLSNLVRLTPNQVRWAKRGLRSRVERFDAVLHDVRIRCHECQFFDRCLSDEQPIERIPMMLRELSTQHGMLELDCDLGEPAL